MRKNSIGETISAHDEHEDCPRVQASERELRRKWTMPNNKTRAASEGPWIALEDIEAFLAFCKSKGHAVRALPRPQVRHDGHWMSLRLNKSFARYTADRRLSLVVQSFAASLPTASKETQQ